MLDGAPLILVGADTAKETLIRLELEAVELELVIVNDDDTAELVINNEMLLNKGTALLLNEGKLDNKSTELLENIGNELTLALGALDAKRAILELSIGKVKINGTALTIGNPKLDNGALELNNE